MLFSGKKFIIPSLLALSAATLASSGILPVGAVTDTLISRAIQMNRLRVSWTDVTAGANTRDPGDSCNGFAKKITVLTVPAGGEINAIVTKPRVAFSGPSIDQIGVVAVRAEQNGVQLSNGDIAVPATDLKDTASIENRLPTSGEIAFYDESDPWDVVAYVCGRDVNSEPMDISGLTRGSVDFYITVTKN